MLPVYESKNAFLYYPIQYEGQECSNNIFYTGATPNQQSEPATFFMYKNSPAAGKPFFLVGSDYVFPRTSNTITKEQLKSLGGEVVGEDYLPLGNTEVAPIIAKIKKALPDGGVIINTLNGDQNVAFFKQIQDAGITPANGYYVMSYSIAEEEISTIGPEFLEGHYGAWNYMMSIDTPASKKFAADFKAKYGADRVVADPQESAYNMVYLWKKAVEKANSFDDDKVREALVGVTFDAPPRSDRSASEPPHLSDRADRQDHLRWSVRNHRGVRQPHRSPDLEPVRAHLQRLCLRLDRSQQGREVQALIL